MAYWLVKSPFKSRTWARVLAQGEFRLYGIRNAQARNYLAQMRAGDQAVFYFEQKAWGVMRVNSAAESDATSETGQWLAIAFAPTLTFESAIPYQHLKAHPLFAESPLVRQPRLSVVPLTEAQWEAVVRM